MDFWLPFILGMAEGALIMGMIAATITLYEANRKGD